MISALLPACILFYILVFPSSVFAADVVLNEFQVDPSSSQWVELYNTSASTVDISGWIIDDSGSPSTKYTISQNTILPSNTCLTFTSGNFNFNTASSDSAQLISGSTVIDVYSYSKSAGNGVSFGRIPDGTGGWISMSPSSGSLNATGDPCIPPVTPTPTPTNTPTPTPTPTPSATSAPTATSVPTSTRTPTPTSTRILSSTPTIEISEEVYTDVLHVPAILGVEADDAATKGVIESSGSGRTNDKFVYTKSLIIALLFISTGIGFFSIASLITKIDI